MAATYEWTRAYRHAFNSARRAADSGPGNARAFQAAIGRTTSRAPIPLLAGSAALNSGFIAFGFFSLREYLVSPTLRGLRTPAEELSDRLSWSDLRLRHVLDSSIAGAMVGAAINAFKRGAVGIPAGAITASIACSLGQVVVNEANIQRVKYASTLTIPPSHPVPEASPRKSILDHALRLIGVTRANDEEYLQKLKWQRERLLKRIQELEKEESETFKSSGALEDNRNDGA